MSLELGAQSLNHWTTREVPLHNFFKLIHTSQKEKIAWKGFYRRGTRLPGPHLSLDAIPQAASSNTCFQ